MEESVTGDRLPAAGGDPESSKFEGFPAGELRFTSVPDLFFAGLLPMIDNLAELKVTLHVIWLRQRERRQVLTQAELAADETLVLGLAALGDDAYSLLREGLTLAVARGSLLQATVATEAGPQEVYVLNSEGGRRALARVQAGELGAIGSAAVDRPSTERRPNIFELYEDNIGLLSPILADELREAEEIYPATWIEDAFRIAVTNNVRKWRYIQAILESWATEGKDDGTSGRDTEKKRRWYTDEEFETFSKH
jgi:DnaD/phage-associated family protein